MIISNITFVTSVNHLSLSSPLWGRRFQSNGKSIEQRRRELDPDLWKQKSWVIEDPGDPSEVLYLKEREYHAYNRVALSNEMALVLIARPTTPPELIGPERKGDSATQSSSLSVPSSQTKRPFHTFSFKNSPLKIRYLGGFFQVGIKDRLVTLDNSNVAQLLVKYTRQVYFWVYGRLTAEQLRVALVFMKEARGILKHQGPSGLVLRLKTSLIVLNSFVSGYPKQSTFDLGCYVALSNGLPKGLPLSVRQKIRSGDLAIIRVWASIFNLYKACKGGYGPIPIDTIQSPPLNTDISDLSYIFGLFFRFQSFIPKTFLNAKFMLEYLGKKWTQLRSTKAGPNEKISFRGAYADMIAWASHPKAWGLLLYFLYPARESNRPHYEDMQQPPVADDFVDEERVKQKYVTQNMPCDTSHLPKGDPRKLDPFRKVREIFFLYYWHLTDFLPTDVSRMVELHTIGFNPTFVKFKRNALEKVPLLYFGVKTPEQIAELKRKKRLNLDKMWKNHILIGQKYLELYSDPNKPIWKNRRFRFTPEQALEQQGLALLREGLKYKLSRLSPRDRITIRHKSSYIYEEFKFSLGKLSIIHEAAGKNRIIAIIDYWSQSILRILHDYIFKLLPYFPGDATFDQEGTLRTFAARDDISYHASYDLSSATDLLPRQLYVAVLQPIFGLEFVLKWMDLLTDRIFSWTPTRDTINKVTRGNKLRPVAKVRHKLLPIRYTRGQPMGAYSSWGLLAIAHHMIVQLASFMVFVRKIFTEVQKSPYWDALSPLAQNEILHLGFIESLKYERFDVNCVLRPLPALELIALIPKIKTFLSSFIRVLFAEKLLPFDKYVLLGDDIVIGDKDVADQYYELMNYVLGVPIKLAKSFISENGLINFANQTYLRRQNISPIPSKEALGSEISGRMEFARRIARRWTSKPLDALFKLRLMVKPSVYLHLVSSMAKSYVLLPLIPLCLHLELSDATVGLTRSKVKRGLNPSETSFEASLGSIGHNLSSASSSYDRILGSRRNLTEQKPDGTKLTEWKTLFYSLVIRYVIKSFVHPVLGDARESVFVNSDDAERNIKQMQLNYRRYLSYKKLVTKYGIKWWQNHFYRTEYLLDDLLSKCEIVINLSRELAVIDTLDLLSLSQLLRKVVKDFDVRVYLFLSHPRTSDLLQKSTKKMRGWSQLFFEHLEDFQVQEVLEPESSDDVLSMRFVKYLLRFNKLIHRTPYALRGPEQSDPPEVTEEPGTSCLGDGVPSMSQDGSALPG